MGRKDRELDERRESIKGKEEQSRHMRFNSV